MDLDIDEDFQIMDDVFSIEEDEEISLVLEEETLRGFENNLVVEESATFNTKISICEPGKCTLRCYC